MACKVLIMYLIPLRNSPKWEVRYLRNNRKSKLGIVKHAGKSFNPDRDSRLSASGFLSLR